MIAVWPGHPAWGPGHAGATAVRTVKVVTTYAVRITVNVAGGVDDDPADRLLDALTRYSGALAITDADPRRPAAVELALDVDAKDAGASAQAAIEAARRVLLVAELPDDGEVLEILVQTAAEQEQSGPVLPKLLGLSEVGEMLGVSRQRVTQLRQRADFPDPVQTLRSGPVWTAPSLRHFQATWDRSPGRRAVSA